MEIELELISDLPPFYEISDYLWGRDANIDSDGNSNDPAASKWTELTLILRSDESQRIDIDPIEGKEGFLKLRAEDLKLGQRVVSFLKQYGAIK